MSAPTTTSSSRCRWRSLRRAPTLRSSMARRAGSRSTGGRCGSRGTVEEPSGSNGQADGMTEPRWHLAQLNVGRMVAPTTAPEIAEFMAALDPINALADAAPGFVWRLQTEEGNATDIHAFDDELMLLNMSVWESIETLRAFTYTTAHTDVLRRRREWFERLEGAHLVLWWGPAGPIPSNDQAIDRPQRGRPGGADPGAFPFPGPLRPRAGPPGRSGSGGVRVRGPVRA